MADHVPHLFLVLCDGRYVVTEAILSVDRERLPPAVARAIDEALASAAHRVEGVRLPPPGDKGSALSIFQSFKTIVAEDLPPGDG